MKEMDLIIKRMEELINDNNSLDAYIEYDQMIQDTYDEAFKDGELTSKLEIAKKLKKEKMDNNYIIKITGLTKDYLNML